MTDGTRGTADMSRDLRYMEIRKKEAEQACKILGVKELKFWDLEEGRLRYNEHTISWARELLKDLKPSAIFLPSFFDWHLDHVEANKIFSIALQENNFQTSINVYEIWNPLPVNRLIDISDVFNLKREALLKYSSQLENLNYLKGIEGLNSYRATITGKSRTKTYAEGFIHCSTKHYLQKLIGR